MLSELSQKQSIINNLLINYYQAQNQNGWSLVFLHGWRADATIWFPVIDLLKGNFSIYAPDLPGFGKSEIPKIDFTLQDYCNIVKKFIAGISEPVCLIGHSFGGRIAIKLLANDPNIAARLVLIDSAGVKTENAYIEFKKTLFKIFKPLLSLPLIKILRQYLLQKISSEDYLARPELRGTFVKIISEDLKPFLRQVRVKTLILWGENDKDTPLDHGRIMEKLIPNSRLVILPKAGHFSFLDDQPEFIKLLNQFLKENTT